MRRTANIVIACVAGGLAAWAVATCRPSGHKTVPVEIIRLQTDSGITVFEHDLQKRITSEIALPTRPITLIDLPDSDVAAAARSLRSALDVYPAGFLHTMLHRVVMAGDITVFGIRAGGLYHDDMVAISYVDVEDGEGARFSIDTLHHELSSIVRQHVTFNDTQWEAANPQSFGYMDEAGYRRVLANPGSVDGDPALHQAGFVSLYGKTSLDNDWNTYAEKVFGHGATFAREIAPYPKMRQKTRQLLDIYQGLDSTFANYFARTGLRAAVARDDPAESGIR